MIKQDTEAALARAVEQRQIIEERKARERKHSGGWRLLAVQSIACVVIILLALFVRLGGGTAYEQLRQVFGENLMRNDLLAALAAVWDGDPTASLPSDPLETDGESTTTDTTTTITTATTTTATTTTTTTTTTTAAGVSTGGRLPPEGTVAVALRVNHPACLPLETGRITSGYGYRQNPTGEGEQFHRGVDIAAPQGTLLKAMFGGQVTAAGTSDSLGNYVTLKSGETAITYGHCAQVLVTRDTVVRAGETVALVGATGDVTGSHVHIAVSVNGVYYHPGGIVPVEHYA